MAERIFVAGASGAVGRALLRLGEGRPLLPHYRTRSAHKAVADAAVFDLDERGPLVESLRNCRAVLQLIGTVRKRFKDGDTYESSDIQMTRFLVEAAETAGVEHFVLLSSVMAGSGLGPYLAAKQRVEALVAGSGVAHTIFRPSSFVGDRHRVPPGSGLVTALPGLRRFKPIAVDDLARTLLWVADEGRLKGEVLEGGALWQAVAAARDQGYLL